VHLFLNVIILSFNLIHPTYPDAKPNESLTVAQNWVGFSYTSMFDTSGEPTSLSFVFHKPPNPSTTVAMSSSPSSVNRRPPGPLALGLESLGKKISISWSPSRAASSPSRAAPTRPPLGHGFFPRYTSQHHLAHLLPLLHAALAENSIRPGCFPANVCSVAQPIGRCLLSEERSFWLTPLRCLVFFPSLIPCRTHLFRLQWCRSFRSSGFIPVQVQG
jgi:hypothetical protein